MISPVTPFRQQLNKYFDVRHMLLLYLLLLFQFLREELKYESGYEKRHKAFHHNDDLHISVKELWEAWLRSEVEFYLFVCVCVCQKSIL